ncbi:GTPase and tRNA-U34 5-formylation enzyme TrmE [hydrothermal vent metagenome]|uniref:GTPase and tRNA-U34 5-formylation enzyme TrmE n=1 Tax=hydrothermal vent metagenome TaxID=652676 RepID=A0A3B1DYR3_9ZZZZ
MVPFHPTSQPATIIACATAPGRADRAIIRLSGPAVPDLAEHFIQPIPRERIVSVCDIHLAPSQWGGRLARPALLCPAIVLFARAPATYTGEDTLEIILPGNPNLVERVIDQWCAHEGVRRAGPGEFSSRAYLNGKLSLDQAEGIAALIAARSADDLAAARQLALGETGSLYRAWAAELATLLALVEAGIDFVDQEDVVPVAPDELCARLARLRAEMASRATGELAAQAEGARPLVVLVGVPNAGKSTLFNALLGRRRSVVAEEVGTTRDVLLEVLHLAEVAGPGLSVQLADLPGLDATSSSQALALEAIHRADAVVHCDPSGEFSTGLWAIPESTPVLRVRTKADQPGGREGSSGDVEVCALDGWHLGVVRRGIADIALRAPGGSCSVALTRHAREITHAVEQLAAAEAQLDPTARALDAPELVADGLRSALDQLEHVLGRVTPDEVIGRIFATFCVGK